MIRRAGLLVVCAWLGASSLVAQEVGSADVYRAGISRPRGSAESIALLEQYVALEPNDAWGHLALAESYAAARRFRAAHRCIARAEELEPDAEDVAITRQRVERVQRNSAPTLQPRLGYTRDSDGNELVQTGFLWDISTGARTRLGAAVVRGSASDALSAHTSVDARLTLHVKSAATRLDASAGAMRVQTNTNSTTPAARARLRWSPRVDGTLVDVRAARAPVLVSPLLMENRVVLTETRATVEVPLAGALRARAIGQLGAFESRHALGATSHNTRTGLGGALVFRARPNTELNATWYQLAYDKLAETGYFSPRLVQILELGTYTEIYRLDPITIALDAGAGAQRLAQHGGEVGEWGLSAHGWTQITLPLSRSFAIDLEGEAYRSQVNAVTTNSSWSSVSATLALRWRP